MQNRRVEKFEITYLGNTFTYHRVIINNSIAYDTLIKINDKFIIEL